MEKMQRFLRVPMAPSWSKEHAAYQETITYSGS